MLSTFQGVEIITITAANRDAYLEGDFDELITFDNEGQEAAFPESWGWESAPIDEDDCLDIMGDDTKADEYAFPAAAVISILNDVDCDGAALGVDIAGEVYRNTSNSYHDRQAALVYS